MASARPIACPRCSGSMEAGFVVDESYGTRTVAKWVEGEPEPSFWTGIKLGNRVNLDVRTYRCTGCGYLESYA